MRGRGEGEEGSSEGHASTFILLSRLGTLARTTLPPTHTHLSL